MQIVASFSKHDLERLFLTYKRNQPNYSKIKDKIIGPDAGWRYKRNRKSSLFFFAALTFIIAISSAFTLIAEEPDSFVALWMIWGGALVIFVAWSVFYYRTNAYVLQKNQAFFDRFEKIAQQANSLEEFSKNW